MPGSLTPTPVLGLNQYQGTDDWDYTDVNADNQKIDLLPPTVCTSTTRPVTNLFTGRLIWETDTQRLVEYVGGQWVPQTDAGPWIDFSSTIVAYSTMGTTPTPVAKSNITAIYKVIGKTCFAQASATFTAATASGGGLSLPLTAKARSLNCGTLIVTGASAATNQAGVAFMLDTSKVNGITVTTAFIDVPAGHNLRYNVMYELP